MPSTRITYHPMSSLRIDNMLFPVQTSVRMAWKQITDDIKRTGDKNAKSQSPRKTK